MSGYYQMHRGWMDNPVLAGGPFDKRSAWAWLIEQAVWKPRRLRIGGKLITLERGQLCHSLRFIAKAWGWSLPTTRRFLTCLKSDTMIDTATDTGQTVITICNYEFYQSPRISNDTADDTHSETPATQQRHKEEEGNTSLTYVRADLQPGKSLKAELWKFGKAYLARQGMAESRAGGVLRRLGRDYGDEALNSALLAMQKEQPAEAVSWLHAACKEHGAKPRPLPDDFALSPDLASYISQRIRTESPQAFFQRFCRDAQAYNRKFADPAAALMLAADNAVARMAR